MTDGYVLHHQPITERCPKKTKCLPYIRSAYMNERTYQHWISVVGGPVTTQSENLFFRPAPERRLDWSQIRTPEVQNRDYFQGLKGGMTNILGVDLPYYHAESGSLF